MSHEEIADQNDLLIDRSDSGHFQVPSIMDPLYYIHAI
jgi:hypothetical protein